jgi:hypothetical protein
MYSTAARFTLVQPEVGAMAVTPRDSLPPVLFKSALAIFMILSLKLFNE